MSEGWEPEDRIMNNDIEAERRMFEEWVCTYWRPDDGGMLLEKEFPKFAFAAWQAGRSWKDKS